MIKMNGIEYASESPSEKATYAILQVNRMTDIQVVEFGSSEDLSKTSVAAIRGVLDQLKLRLPERVILMTIGLLNGDPNDFVVFLIDLYERFFIGVPTMTRVVNDIYPEGFYTPESLKERVAWIRKHKDELKRPALVEFLED